MYLSRFLIRVSACKDSLAPRPRPKNRKRGQMIGEFVSVTRMDKQHSPISIVHRSPANMQHHCHMYVGDTDDAITSYIHVLPYCMVGTFGLVRMWRGHVPCGFILQSDWLLKIWEVMVNRKYMEMLPGPFPDFLGGAWGRGYAQIAYSQKIWWGIEFGGLAVGVELPNLNLPILIFAHNM